MARLLGEVSLLALGVMVSPSCITLIILLILKNNGISYAGAFVAGRLLAMFLLVFSVLIFFRNVDFSPKSTSSLASSAVKLVIGILLLLLGTKIALGKSSGGEAGWLQRRMDSVDRLSPLNAGGLGFALIILSPRNLFLILATAATILHADLSVADGITALAVFVIIGNLGVLAPLIVYLSSPEKSTSLLDRAYRWIIHYQRMIVLAVLFVLGAYLVIRGTLDLCGIR